MSTKMLFALGLGGLSAVVSMAFLAGWPGGLLVVYLAPLPLLLAGLGGGGRGRDGGRGNRDHDRPA